MHKSPDLHAPDAGFTGTPKDLTRKKGGLKLDPMGRKWAASQPPAPPPPGQNDPHSVAPSPMDPPGDSAPPNDQTHT